MKIIAGSPDRVKSKIAAFVAPLRAQAEDKSKAAMMVYCPITAAFFHNLCSAGKQVFGQVALFVPALVIACIVTLLRVLVSA